MTSIERYELRLERIARAQQLRHDKRIAASRAKRAADDAAHAKRMAEIDASLAESGFFYGIDY